MSDKPLTLAMIKDMIEATKPQFSDDKPVYLNPELLERMRRDFGIPSKHVQIKGVVL